MSAVPLLFIGKTSITEALLKPYEQDIESLLLPFEIESLLEPIAPLPQAIFCYPPSTEVSILEAAQALRMQYPQQPVYFIGLASEGYEKKELLKNGFDDVFLLPLDRYLFEKTLFEQIAQGKKKAQFFRSVELIDLKPNSVLDFDIYLFMPVNKKYIIFYRAGENLTEEMIEKLKKNKIHSMSIDSKDNQKFYQYTASRLSQLNTENQPSMSETERKEKLQQSVRQLFSSMLSGSNASIQTGKQVIDDFRGVIQTFIVQSGKGDWHQKIKKLMTDSHDSYDHASATASFAALFSMGLGIGNAEEMALTGLLHDIGTVLIPLSILEKNPENWTLEERKEYEKHPDHSVNLIQNKKLTLSALAYKMIGQHHEKYNGSGYPKGLAGNKICPEAQILSIADRFDEIIHTAQNKRILSLREGLEILKKEYETGAYDPVLFQKILELFPLSSD